MRKLLYRNERHKAIGKLIRNLWTLRKELIDNLNPSPGGQVTGPSLNPSPGGQVTGPNLNPSLGGQVTGPSLNLSPGGKVTVPSSNPPQDGPDTRQRIVSK